MEDANTYTSTQHIITSDDIVLSHDKTVIIMVTQVDKVGPDLAARTPLIHVTGWMIPV